MGIFQQFPYTNFHELNLDEILKIVKSLKQSWDFYFPKWSEFFDNLDVQDEVDNKIDNMVESGELTDILTPAVNEWLNEKIDIFDLNQFVKAKEYDIVQDSYIEALAYGTGYIYAGVRNLYDNDSSTIYTINSITLDIEDSFTIPIKILNGMEYYNGDLYATMVTDSLGIYKISLEDHSYSLVQSFTVDHELYLSYDRKTEKFIISQHDNDNETLILNIYDNLTDPDPVRTVTVPLEFWDIGESVQQDRCCYNNIFYILNWYGLTVIDVETGVVVKRFGCKNDVEPEGIFRTEDACMIALHNVGQNGHEYIFKLEEYSDSRIGLGAMTEDQGFILEDVNFTYVRGQGTYAFTFTDQATAQSLGMPKLAGLSSNIYPTQGILKVDTMPSDEWAFLSKGIVQTIYDTVNNRQFTRISTDRLNYSAWEESPMNYYKTEVVTDYDTTYFSTTSLLVRRIGAFTIVYGFFNGSTALPSTIRIKLAKLPVHVERTVTIPAILMEGGTYNGNKITCYVQFNDSTDEVYLYTQGVVGKSGLLQFSGIIF